MRGILLFCFGLSTAASAQVQNSKILEVEGKGHALTPSIAVNRRDVKSMVVTVATGQSFYSADGGSTWKESKPESENGFYGDPALVSNSKGEFFYFHSSNPKNGGPDGEAWLDRIVCQKSEDHGTTWEAIGSIGNSQTKDFVGPRAVSHGKKHVLFATWTQFDKYEGKDANCTSNIYFSLSTNGNKWDRPIQVNQTPGDCQNGDNSARGASPAVSMEGRGFIAWANKELIFFDRSYDGGKTWLSNDLAITQQPGGWAMDVPGFGTISGTPSLAIDISQQRSHGTLSIVFADQRNGENDTDIWYIRSTNSGDNWTPAMRINQDGKGKHQFLPALTIDQTTGNIFIAFYDRRAYDDLQTDLYLAYSFDGGNSFAELKLSETPFVASADGALGNGLAVSAHGGVATVAWTRTDGSRTSMWTSVVKADQLVWKK